MYRIAVLFENCSFLRSYLKIKKHNGENRRKFAFGLESGGCDYERALSEDQLTDMKRKSLRGDSSKRTRCLVTVRVNLFFFYWYQALLTLLRFSSRLQNCACGVPVFVNPHYIRHGLMDILGRWSRWGYRWHCMRHWGSADRRGVNVEIVHVQ